MSNCLTELLVQNIYHNKSVGFSLYGVIIEYFLPGAREHNDEVRYHESIIPKKAQQNFNENSNEYKTVLS